MLYSWSIIGHEAELINLERDIQSNSLSHAYLFVGGQGVGKFHIAQTFSGILQCPNDYCRRCPTCIQVAKNIHQDTVVMKNLEEESIKIGMIRELVDRISLSKQSRYKVVIIEDTDRLTLEAANALLKTLEEPPTDTIFIATARNVKNLLPTLVSRMRVITFKKPARALVLQNLKELYPTTEHATIELALNLSFGSGGVARNLIENPEALYELKKQYDEVAYLYEKQGLAERITKMGELSKEDGDAKGFMERLLYFLHGKLHESLPNEAERLRLVDHIERTHKALQLYEKNINTRLVLEHLSIHLVK